MKIEPCPFCGSLELITIKNGYFYVYCESCGSTGPKFNAEQCAISSWNYRYKTIEDKAPCRE